MKIGIDIDDTITKTSEQVDLFAREYVEEVLQKKFELHKLEVINPYSTEKLYGWTKREDKKFWDLYYEKIVENVKPKENAIRIINKLAKDNEIVIITSRLDRENGAIAQITNKWFEKNKVNYHKLFIGYEDKEKIVKENNIDIFIDDNYKICKKVARNNVRILMMNSRANKEIVDNKLERVFSWHQIEQKIKGEN